MSPNRRSLMVALSVAAVVLAACSTLIPSTSEVARAGQTVRTLSVPYTNAHLLIQNGRGVLIDAAGPEQAEDIERLMIRSGFDPAQLVAVIVTHGHHDHAGGAPYFRDRYGVPIIAGAGDRALLEAGRNDTLCPTGAFAALRHAEDQAGTYEGYSADVYVSAPYDLQQRFGIDAVVTPLPGHTKGSLIVTAGEDVFVGDLIRGTLVGGGAARHFYMCDLMDNRADIGRVLTEIAPAGQRFHMGHFPSTTRAAVEGFLAGDAGNR